MGWNKKDDRKEGVVKIQEELSTEVNTNSEEEKIKNKLFEEYIASSHMRKEADMLSAHIDDLNKRKSNIETEIADKLKEAFKAKEEEIMFAKRELDKRELAINDKDNSLQFIINSNNDFVNKIKKEYADKVNALSVKEKELSDIRESLMLKMNEVDSLKKEFLDKTANLVSIEADWNDENIKLSEEKEKVKSLKAIVENEKAMVESLNLKIQAVYENNLKKESELSSLVSEYNDKVSLIKIQEVALLKSKKQFEDDAEKVGHDIKKQKEELKIIMDAIREKENALSEKQSDVDEQKRFLALKERQIDEKIKILKELRNQGGTNV